MKDSARKAMFAKQNNVILIRKGENFWKSPIADTICKRCGKKTTHQFTHECVGCGVRRINETKCLFCNKKYINHSDETHDFVAG